MGDANLPTMAMIERAAHPKWLGSDGKEALILGRFQNSWESCFRSF